MIEQILIVESKVVGLEKEEHASTRLVGDAGRLFVTSGFGQEQVAAIFAARRRNDTLWLGSWACLPPERSEV